MYFVSQDYEREIEFEPTLTDQEWGKIAPLGGFSLDDVEVRRLVDDGIGLYRNLAATPTVKEAKCVREILKEARGRVDDEPSRRGDLEAIYLDERVWSCLRIGREGRLQMSDDDVQSCRRRLQQLRDCPTELAEWYDHAIKRSHTGRSGKEGQKKSLLALVSLLNQAFIMREKGPINRSKKLRYGFVPKICIIAMGSAISSDKKNKDLISIVDKALQDIASDWKDYAEGAIETRSIFDLDIGPLLARDE